MSKTHTTTHRSASGTTRRTTTTVYDSGASKSVTRKGPFNLLSNGSVERVTRRDAKGNTVTKKY